MKCPRQTLPTWARSSFSLSQRASLHPQMRAFWAFPLSYLQAKSESYSGMHTHAAAFPRGSNAGTDDYHSMQITKHLYSCTECTSTLTVPI